MQANKSEKLMNYFCCLVKIYANVSPFYQSKEAVQRCVLWQPLTIIELLLFV